MFKGDFKDIQANGNSATVPERMSGRELRARSSWPKKSFQERLAYRLKWRFPASARSLSESGLLTALM